MVETRQKKQTKQLMVFPLAHQLSSTGTDFSGALFPEHSVRPAYKASLCAQAIAKKYLWIRCAPLICKYHMFKETKNTRL